MAYLSYHREGACGVAIQSISRPHVCVVMPGTVVLAIAVGDTHRTTYSLGRVAGTGRAAHTHLGIPDSCPSGRARIVLFVTDRKVHGHTVVL